MPKVSTGLILINPHRLENPRIIEFELVSRKMSTEKGVCVCVCVFVCERERETKPKGGKGKI